MRAPDPGGVFDSDVHRRVLGHVPLDEHMSTEDLYNRLAPDEHTPVGFDELPEVLKDLEAEGFASMAKDGWKVTKRGLDQLNAPVKEN